MSVPVDEITAERLARWSKRLSESHASPIILVGIGHDQVAGQIVICAPDEKDLDTDTLCAFLQNAIRELHRSRK